MQWLIDIIKAWIIAQGYLTAGFVDRGDPAVHDFSTGDFIPDNAWHELDLSGIVPANAKGVCLSIRVYDDHVGSHIQFRRAGNSNTENRSQILTQVANEWMTADLTVPLDANRKIEYKSLNVTWGYLRLTVKGWWF